MLGLIGYGITRISGGMMASRKKFTEGDIPNARFKDVAGIDETREELEDIVSFLKDNGQYRTMGARMPRGVLLGGDRRGLGGGDGTGWGGGGVGGGGGRARPAAKGNR